MTWIVRKQNKYRNVFTAGYASKKEAGYGFELELKKKSGEIKDYKKQVRFDLYGKNGNKICSHIVDFLVDMPDGTQEVHEVKSYITMTSLWAVKRKLFEDNYGDKIPYIVIK